MKSPHPPGRPAPPAAASPPPPSLPPSLPLPSALVPPKKRRVFHTPRPASTPIPPPPPPRALASPAAAAAGIGAPEVPSPTPPPLARAAAAPPSAKEPPSPLVRIPSSPPLTPPPDDKPSPPPPTDAVGRPATPRKVRNYRRKVVPRGRIANPESPAAGAAAAARGESHPGEECEVVKEPAGDRNAGSDQVVDKGQNLGETAVEKPVTGFSAAVACEALLGKKRASEGGALPGKPEACAAAPEVGKLVSMGEEGSEVGMPGCKRRRKREVFVGGLDRDAREEDVRAALAEAGEITEVWMVMDAHKVKKNKGFCFVGFREAAQARKAIEEFSHVKICESLCRVAALETNDKIFLGNIDKKWTKEDITKLLQKIRVENIYTVMLKADPSKAGYNLGYAHLELETTADARLAYKKLSKKGVFGKGLNITVEWAEPLNGPDVKEMQKVKSVFVEGIPNSWNRGKMTEIFKKYGKVEHVVLSCDMRSGISSDIGYIHYTTHEAAILCVESFDGQELAENDAKVNIKVSLAKPFRKGRQNKDHKLTPYPIQDNPTREKRNFLPLGADSSYHVSRNPRARYDSTYAMSTSSYGVPPHFVAGYSPPYHHDSGRFFPDFNYGVEPWCGSLMRQPGYCQLGQLHGNRH